MASTPPQIGRKYRCNSVILCMSHLAAFETPTEQEFCANHGVYEGLEEIFPPDAEPELKSWEKPKHRHFAKWRKTPAYGHQHQTCDCGLCGKFREFLECVEGKRISFLLRSSIKRQFGVKLTKDGRRLRVLDK